MTVDTTGTVVGYDDYYPYGMQMSGRSYTSSADQRYKFTGKELDATTGLDYFGARYYDSWNGRWPSVDPMTSKYPGWSPYNYCMNNPINSVDLHGDSVWVCWQTGFWSFLGWGHDHKGLYQDGKLYENAEEYNGDNTFANATRDALNTLQSGGDIGDLVVSGLENSNINYLIKKSNGDNTFDSRKQTVLWNPDNKTGGLNINGKNDRPSYIGLAHELGHAIDFDNRMHGDAGSWSPDFWFKYHNYEKRKDEDVQINEKAACIIENQIRLENKIPLREYYSTTKYPGANILFP
jgi:RHS repeat-associated protein